MSTPGPWGERLPHFRMEFMPSSGDELQSEYFVPCEYGAQAIEAIFSLEDLLTPMVQISEIRTIAADDYWMSPFYHRASVALHFTWVHDWEAVRTVLPLIEKALLPFGVRTHWGKLFTLDADYIRAQYVKRNDFLQLVSGFDPHGKFQNDFLATYL